jgi:hypothetical protein
VARDPTGSSPETSRILGVSHKYSLLNGIDHADGDRLKGRLNGALGRRERFADNLVETLRRRSLVSSITRSALQRLRSGASATVHGSQTEAEILRQLTDVFRELARLSTDLGAIWRSLEETKVKVDDLNRKFDAQATTLAHLADDVTEAIDGSDESIALLGRLLQSTRSRLDVLEGARGDAAGHS